MSKYDRNTPSPSSPSSSKLPKFLQKGSRDRSRSMVDSSGSSSTIATSSSNSPPLPDSSKTNIGRPASRNTSKRLFGSREDKRRQSQDIIESPVQEHVDSEAPLIHHQPSSSSATTSNYPEETPVIVEPVAIPRPRTRSERPLSDNYPGFSSSSANRISDFPSRLSGWFSHTFSTSSTDLTQLPAVLAQQHLASTSPKSKGAALLTAAKVGTRQLDKAMRYLLDSDATPDKCSDPIWLLGIDHPGYEPTPPSVYPGPAPGGRRGSINTGSHTSLQLSPTSSPTSAHPDPSLSQSQPQSANVKDPGRHWPPVFYADFTSRIWVTYRSHFQPIRDITLQDLEHGDEMSTTSSPAPKKWNWPLGGEKTWSSDAGWGCMLRTGQSLLANSLLHLHLGRDWRRPPRPVNTADYATYVQILTWFLDDPSPLCPFSVHRMALVGKSLGVKVGQWFGPSTAAGAIKTLVHAFPECALGISIADSGTIYESEVLQASHTPTASPRRGSKRQWGDRAVLILVCHRLGLDGVNPVYYETLKTLYTWPQSVGIAGGRPSSSYYFVGSQADNLFYLDPHHARQTIPLRPPPGPEDWHAAASRQTSPDPPSLSDRERDHDRHQRTPKRHMRHPTSPTSARSSGSISSGFSHRGVISPSPLQQQLSASSTSSAASSGSHARWHTSSAVHDESEMDDAELGIEGSLADLDPIQRHYVTAYSPNELKTFHCDRVRKMPLSGLDPSMLMGFLIKDEHEWNDFKSRVTELNRKHKATVLAIHDEPPNWTSETDLGLESLSEPDIDMPEDEEDEDEDSSSEMGQSRSRSASVSSPDTSVSAQGHRASTSSKGDTEEDPIDPITPGAGRTTFEIVPMEATSSKGSAADEGTSLDFDDEEDEDWADPAESPQTPSPAWTAPSLPSPHPSHFQSHLQAPRLSPSYSGSSMESSASERYQPRERRKSKKSSSSAHTITRSGSSSHPPPVQPQYPFPASYPAEEEPMARSSTMSVSGKRVPQMRTAKAKDGGRTQSGGVRGVPTDDCDDF